MAEALAVGNRHALRELKSGTIGLTEACSLEELADERLLDLIGFAFIGALRGTERQRAGWYALGINHELDIGPHLTPRNAPPELISLCARRVADAAGHHGPPVGVPARRRRWLRHAG